MDSKRKQFQTPHRRYNLIVKLSIIIPALNEAANIGAVLQPLQPMRARGVDVIVVDAGSVDTTREIAALLADRVLTSEPGRAKQMNAGANVATGDVLLFLHADSILPANGDELIKDALSNSRFKWGRFDVNIAGTHGMLPVVAWFMNHRSRLTGIATGDQGIFVNRETFIKLGGFPDQPLMEDVAFCSRMLGVSRPNCLAARIITSGRRWEKHGVWRTIFLMWRLRLNYFMGADPIQLHRTYYGTNLSKQSGK
jgi:rSAM/selenodomain-associated transferase 2